MQTQQIRSTFFRYFDDLGHLRMPPGSLIPDDDGMLLTGAGMVQFKPYFLGLRPPPALRLMSSQPCVRTVDIDNIGHTTRHATSFEMLGSFSFGSYFKIEAMEWALRLLTQGYGLERERLWVTVFHEDLETLGLWRRLGMPVGRVQRLGLKTISGLWGYQAQPARIRRSSMTGATGSAPRAGRLSTASAILSCGTWSSCSMSEASPMWT